VKKLSVKDSPGLISKTNIPIPLQRAAIPKIRINRSWMSIFWLYRKKGRGGEGRGEGEKRAGFIVHSSWNLFSGSWWDKLSLSSFFFFPFLSHTNHLKKPFFFYIYFSVGFQRVTDSTSPWVWGEHGTIGWQVWRQARVPAQSHAANFALKCPRCRTPGQVGGHPLQSCSWRNAHRGIDERDWTQEEPVVAMLEPQVSLPLPLSCV